MLEDTIEKLRKEKIKKIVYKFPGLKKFFFFSEEGDLIEVPTEASVRRTFGITIVDNCPFPEGVREKGTSGILSRRWLVIPVKKRKQKVIIVKAGLFSEEIIGVGEEEFPDYEDYKKKQEWLEEQKKKAIKRKAEKLVQEWFRDYPFDVREIKEFNKTPVSEHLPEGYVVIYSRMTSCGNVTAVIAKKKPVLRVSKQLKGLIIGKGGQNIRKFKKYGIYRVV